MEEGEVFDDVVKLLDTYVAMIDKQDEIIIALKEEIKFLRRELNLPSHIITSPPTPFSVDTCEESIGSECK
tara:strand:- start:2468 stop:2680 length:213 start_codon:yes stop_codon:yes gene_type:complete